MTARTEGEAAIKAAAAKVRLLLNGETPTNATVAKEVVTAYLAALPGWRLVPIHKIIGRLDVPPAPGLEKETEHE